LASDPVAVGVGAVWWIVGGGSIPPMTAGAVGLVAENSCFIVGTEELSSMGASIGSALPPRGLLEGRGVLRDAAAAGGRNEMSQYSYCKEVGYKTITQHSPTGTWLAFDFSS
jgi:hypothetical protein